MAAECSKILASIGIFLDIIGVLLIFCRSYIRISDDSATKGNALAASLVLAGIPKATRYASVMQETGRSMQYEQGSQFLRSNIILQALRWVGSGILRIMRPPFTLLKFLVQSALKGASFLVKLLKTIVIDFCLWPVRKLSGLVCSLLKKINIEPSFSYEVSGVIVLVFGFTLQIAAIWITEIFSMLAVDTCLCIAY